MGVYNCASTLEEALDSLLAQTYKRFKVVMCDDGSKDDTLKVAEGYARDYDNIIVIKNECNMGLNYTLNHCLEYADTEYVARMDGDDISLPDRFQKEIDFLDSHPEYAIVSTPMIYFDENGVFKTCRSNGYEPKVKNFAKGTPFCHAPCMVRKEAYDAVEGYSVDDKLLRVEDYHLWIKMYARGFKGYMMGEPLYMMRDDRNAVVRRNFKNRINEAYVRYLACKTFDLPLRAYFSIFKPIIVGLLPQGLYLKLHRR